MAHGEEETRRGTTPTVLSRALAILAMFASSRYVLERVGRVLN